MNLIYFLDILILFFTIIGLVRFKNIINPIFVFNGVWLICFLFLSMNLSKYYTNKINEQTTLIFVLVFLIFNLSFYISYNIRHFNSKGLSIKLIHKKNKKNYILTLFYIWLLLIIVETIYCRGVPIIWQFQGSSKTYADYGIPSLHGFVNSLSWFILLISFIYYLEKKDSKILQIIIIINVVYIILFARQSIITEIIQLTVIFAYKRKLKYKKLLYIGIFTILIFGIIGSIRTDLDHLIYTSGLKIHNFPFFLSGFIWVYMYLMTPLANIINIIEINNIFTYGLASLSSFLPTVIVKMFNFNIPDTKNMLISQTYNVSTSFDVLFIDFGIIGILIFILFLGINGGKLYRKLTENSNDSRTLCNYSVYIGILALTFFSNMLLSLPIVTQYIYINVLFRNYFKLEN